MMARSPCLLSKLASSCSTTYSIEVLTERRTPMTKTIKWEKDFDRVLTLARAENKMVLLDFYNPL